VFFFLKAIDFLNQSNVFFHNLVVLLGMELCVLFQSDCYVLQVSLEMLSFASVFLVQVAFSCRRCSSGNVSLWHVLFIETHHRLFKLLVIVNLTEHFVNIILKLPFVGLLSDDFFSKLHAFRSQAPHFLLEIINDQF